jgi:hypothetical protein
MTSHRDHQRRPVPIVQRTTKQPGDLVLSRTDRPAIVWPSCTARIADVRRANEIREGL